MRKRSRRAWEKKKEARRKDRREKHWRKTGVSEATIAWMKARVML